MRDPPASPMDSIENVAQAVAGSVKQAAGCAAAAARQTSDGVTEFRAVTRGQPLTVALLMIGLGYVLGRMSSRAPH